MARYKLTETIAAEAFRDELIDRILDLGLGSLSKNDLYDFILYLASKHSSTAFLDRRSNYENAIAFKVSETKIKNSKLNIALKFKAPGEQKEALGDFLFRIANGQIILLEKEKDSVKVFEFVLDDPFVRMLFESRLKVKEGVTFDYEINRERVIIEKSHFLGFIKDFADEKEDHFLKELGKQLRDGELRKKLQDRALGFGEKLEAAAVDLTVQGLVGLLKSLALGLA
jgi:hypothetical protein